MKVQIEKGGNDSIQFMIQAEGAKDRHDLTNIAELFVLPNVLRNPENEVIEVVFTAPLQSRH